MAGGQSYGGRVSTLAEAAGSGEILLSQQTRLLAAGASFFFRSDLPHSYRNPGRRVARVIWVNAPPF